MYLNEWVWCVEVEGNWGSLADRGLFDSHIRNYLEETFVNLFPINFRSAHLPQWNSVSQIKCWNNPPTPSSLCSVPFVATVHFLTPPPPPPPPTAAHSSTKPSPIFQISQCTVMSFMIDENLGLNHREKPTDPPPLRPPLPGPLIAQLVYLDIPIVLNELSLKSQSVFNWWFNNYDL